MMEETESQKRILVVKSADGIIHAWGFRRLSDLRTWFEHSMIEPHIQVRFMCLSDLIITKSVRKLSKTLGMPTMPARLTQALRRDMKQSPEQNFQVVYAAGPDLWWWNYEEDRQGPVDMLRNVYEHTYPNAEVVIIDEDTAFQICRHKEQPSRDFNTQWFWKAFLPGQEQMLFQKQVQYAAKQLKWWSDKEA